jgi:hypothetical protein
LHCHSPVAGTTVLLQSPKAITKPDKQSLCPVQPEGGCIDCHMPKREALMAHSRFTDHFIRVPPEPELQSKSQP